jgi:hypothetical protein
LALIAMMTNDMREKNEFETSNLDIKNTTYVSWNTSGQIDYQD